MKCTSFILPITKSAKLKTVLISWLGLQKTQTASLQRGKTPEQVPGYDTK